jgi:hypothetical protein
MKKLRAILIDPFARTVTKREVEAENIEAIYALGQFETFAVVNLPNGDALYVDEEGLFRGHQEDADGVKVGFILNGMDPMVGRGVILGANHRTGRSIDCLSVVDDLFVSFFRTDAVIY